MLLEHRDTIGGNKRLHPTIAKMCLTKQELPFGWTWSPLLATRYIRGIIRPIVFITNGQTYQYLDDILIYDHDPHFLRVCALYTAHLLNQTGLYINNKSILVPTTNYNMTGENHYQSTTIDK